MSKNLSVHTGPYILNRSKNTNCKISMRLNSKKLLNFDLKLIFAFLNLIFIEFDSYNSYEWKVEHVNQLYS